MVSARASRPGVTLCIENAAMVIRLCRQLDGLPLAIEIAAAQLATLPLEALVTRLHDRFRLLIGGLPHAAPRQQTLRATMDWSHDLLGARERAALRRLAVFAGSWSLEAAEHICSRPPRPRIGAPRADVEIAPEDALDLLDALIRKSLLAPEACDGHMRYRLLETVREYGQEKLARAGETMETRDRHLAWYAMLCAQIKQRLRGPDQIASLERLDQEHDNLRAALTWSLRDGAHAGSSARRATGARLAGDLAYFWQIRGHLSEGRAWLDVACAHGTTLPAADHAHILDGAALLALHQGAYERVAGCVERSRALWQAAGDERGVARTYQLEAQLAQVQSEFARAGALYAACLARFERLGEAWDVAATLGNLGLLAQERGEHARAWALLEDSLARFRRLGDERSAANQLCNLGLAAHGLGEHTRARALLDESLALFRRLGDRQNSAHQLGNLGIIAQEQGEYERASALLGECLALYRALGDRWGSAASLVNLGMVAGEQGNLARALPLLREGMALLLALGDRRAAAEGAVALAMVSAGLGAAEHAALLLGAAGALRAELGVSLSGAQQADEERTRALVHAALGDEALARAWRSGETTPLDRLIEAGEPATAAVPP
jgi:tetratricopeptide (TPR) repeat protein